MNIFYLVKSCIPEAYSIKKTDLFWIECLLSIIFPWIILWSMVQNLTIAFYLVVLKSNLLNLSQSTLFIHPDRQFNFISTFYFLNISYWSLTLTPFSSIVSYPYYLILERKSSSLLTISDVQIITDLTDNIYLNTSIHIIYFFSLSLIKYLIIVFTKNLIDG